MFKWKGKRGVARKWWTFTAFLADVGLRPEGCIAYRLDVEKPWSAENFRWIERREGRSLATKIRDRRRKAREAEKRKQQEQLASLGVKSVISLGRMSVTEVNWSKCKLYK